MSLYDKVMNDKSATVMVDIDPAFQKQFEQSILKSSKLLSRIWIELWIKACHRYGKEEEFNELFNLSRIIVDDKDADKMLKLSTEQELIKFFVNYVDKNFGGLDDEFCDYWLSSSDDFASQHNDHLLTRLKWVTKELAGNACMIANSPTSFEQRAREKLEDIESN